MYRICLALFAFVAPAVRSENFLHHLGISDSREPGDIETLHLLESLTFASKLSVSTLKHPTGEQEIEAELYLNLCLSNDLFNNTVLKDDVFIDLDKLLGTNASDGEEEWLADAIFRNADTKINISLPIDPPTDVIGFCYDGKVSTINVTIGLVIPAESDIDGKNGSAKSPLSFTSDILNRDLDSHFNDVLHPDDNEAIDEEDKGYDIQQRRSVPSHVVMLETKHDHVLDGELEGVDIGDLTNSIGEFFDEDNTEYEVDVNDERRRRFSHHRVLGCSLSYSDTSLHHYRCNAIQGHSISHSDRDPIPGNHQQTSPIWLIVGASVSIVSLLLGLVVVSTRYTSLAPEIPTIEETHDDEAVDIEASSPSLIENGDSDLISSKDVSSWMAKLAPTLWQQWTPNASVSCVAVSDQYICCALEYADCVVLKLWRNSSIASNDPTMTMQGVQDLTGHIERVSCIAMRGNMLCSASSDCVLVWRIAVKGDQIEVSRAMLVDKPKCEISTLVFDASGTLVAFAYHNQIEVMKIHSREVYITLEGHLAKITCQFHPLQPHILVTGSEDRTFKVWDLAEQKLIYQSPILSAHAILVLAVNPKTGDICCGFGDGTLKIYHKFATEIATLALCTMLSKQEKEQQVNEYVDKTLEATQNVVSSLPPWARSQLATESANARNLQKNAAHLASFGVDLPLAGDIAEVSCIILSLKYVVYDAPEESIVDSIHGIFVGTTNYLIFIDALSFEMQVIQSFQSEIPVPVRVAKQVALLSTLSGCESWIVGAFLPCITRLYANVVNKTTPSSSLSVIPISPPLEASILCMPRLDPLKKPPSSSKDQPITFHTRIKSSGYGSEKPKSLSLKFKGLQSKKKPSTPAATSSNNKSPSYIREYPINCCLISQLDALKTKTKLHNGAVNSIQYSTDGSSIATAGNDRIGQVMSKSNSIVLVGHENYVKSIRWSHSNKYLISASSDKSARVWSPPCDVPSIELMQKSDVNDATFFYMDKFLTVATSNRLKLFLYDVDDKFVTNQKRSDIERLENRSRAKAATTYKFESIKSINSIACVNGCLSQLLVVGCSDKSIRIVDVAAGKTARVIPQAHASRAPHTVALPRASSYVSHPPNLYDLVLSAACDSAIHLWDIRADNCVLRFSEHTNRVHSIGIAFSPCMRYVAAGSEDKLIYMYDLRIGRTLEKIHGHNEVVSAVDFHPWKPTLASAAVDGTVKFYLERKERE